MQNTIEQYKRWSQPVQYFLDKYCEYGANLWVTKKALYEAYKLICEDEGLPIVSEEIFSREVRKKPRVILAQKRITGKMERIWVGIALKSEAGEASEASFPLLGKTSETNEKIEKGEIFCGIEEPASPASLASATSSELSSTVQKPTVVRLEPSEMFSSEKCFECGGKPVSFQVNFPDGSWGLLCEKCKEKFKEKTETQPTQTATLTQDNVQRVYEALAEASKVRGSATTEEVALETKLPKETVKAVLEALQREGKAYSPYPEWWKVS
jgi:transcription initiation factor IIE alpha subunit